MAGNNELLLRTELAGLQNYDDRCVPPVLAGLGFNKQNRARWGEGKYSHKTGKGSPSSELRTVETEWHSNSYVCLT